MFIEATNRYKNEFGLAISVDCDGEIRSFLNTGLTNRYEYGLCSWSSTVSTPLTDNEIKYANDIYRFVVNLLGKKKSPFDEEDENNDNDIEDSKDNIYCEYTYLFNDGCNIHFEVINNDPTPTIKANIITTSLDQAISAYLFGKIYTENLSRLKYNYSLSIFSKGGLLIISKEVNKEEKVFGFSNGGKSCRPPQWYTDIKEYLPTDDENNILSIALGERFIEFINQVNLIPIINDENYPT